MTTVGTTVWRPFHDEPLFVPELLHGPGAVPGRLWDQIIGFLTRVAEVRRAPLHTCTAFNALHFGFDLDTHGYRAEVLAPDLFVQVCAEQQQRPVLPVGTFLHIDRGGRRSLLAEVVARYGADPAVDDDGWAPASLSGGPPGQEEPGGARTGVERIILDVEAFGAPLTTAEYIELDRLRRRGLVLDARGHLTGPVHYPVGTGGRDDVALYAAHLLGPGRPLLLGGPLGGLLTDPGDEQVLTAALHQALDTIDRLLDAAGGLRRWHGYTINQDRFERRRRDGWPGLGAADVDDVIATLRRAGPQPRYTGVWPLLASRINAARADADPLELAGAADVVVHTNLVAADLAAAATDGLLPGGVHLRVDDVWQAGGLWRSAREPVPSAVLATDPRTPLGLGHQPGVPDGPEPAQPGSGPSSGGRQPAPSDPPAAHGVPASEEDVAAEQDTPGEADASAEEQGEDLSGLVVVRDSLVVYTIALRESHWDAGELPLAGQGADVLADGPLIMQLHHDGEPLQDIEQIQQISRDGTVLTGISWPWSFYPGIKVTVAIARNATRFSATTTLLDHPLPYGDQYRWDANAAILAAAIGAEQPPAEPAAPPEHQTPLPAGTPERYRGVLQLRGLIIAALRRHGTLGAFGARRLTGPQLLAALFGPDLVAPPLMWEVIYTCDRLVDAGKLTKEPGTGSPDQPASGGPDVFVWWPDDNARRGAHQHTARADILAGRIREHWVPPFLRLLPTGHQASDAARNAYAEWVLKVYGPDADTTLPAGYTFVRGQLRGSGESAGLLHLAVNPHHHPA
ncbi:hypothetical protein AB0B83_22470 [Micromonospora sp. NPDC049060]|uniref:hypothetical protein n=1 Tax=Micromonospora sp. NPDC049060 TaxID=3154828 RepID=UPI0033DF5F15